MSPYDVFRMEDPFTTTLKDITQWCWWPLSTRIANSDELVLVYKVDVLMPKFGIKLS